MSENQLFLGETVHSKRILYTPSAFAKENLFFLQETGSLSAAKVHKSMRSYLESFLFLFVTKGRGSVVSAGREYSLKAGDCVFLDCRLPYSHESSEDLWSLRWVHFNAAAMPSIYRKFMERSGSPLFPVRDQKECEAILNRIYETGTSESYVRDMEVHEALSILLTMIMKDCWKDQEGEAPSPSSLTLVSLRQYLQEHFCEKITLDALSERFFLNKYYLTRLFRRQYGTTISDYILELRIQKAKSLLRFSQLSLDEIAGQCGFYDLAYFSRKFKKAEGISPLSFRRQWR